MSYPIENCDYFIRYREMPPGVYAFIALNPDGTYSMYLDPSRSFDQLLDDWSHELMHIVRDDLYNGLPIYLVEAS